MVRPSTRRNHRRRGRKSRGGRNLTFRVQGTSVSSRLQNYSGFIRLIRVATTTLPLPDSLKDFARLIDIALNLYARVVKSVSYYVGANAMFTISPACLLVNSPLLAKDSNNSYSFPSHPVSMKYLTIRLRNTTQISEHSGRWAAVFITYREEHDSRHYTNILGS